MTDSLSLLGHFKNYREEIKKIEDPVADGPVMPLIGIFIIISSYYYDYYYSHLMFFF
jgi:hypothetical protein